MEDGDEIDAMLHQTGGAHKFVWMYVHLFWMECLRKQWYWVLVSRFTF